MKLPLLLTLCATLSALSRENPGPGSAAMQSFVDDKTIAGAVTLIVGKEGIKSLESTGVKDLETAQPMPKNAMFWIASMTKPMTALAVMMLVEEGELSIDDPVAKHLPEFKNQLLVTEVKDGKTTLQSPARPVTVKDLLTHTSGLTSRSPLEPTALDVLTLREATITYGLTPLQSEPGSKWSYCNTGINTLGRIVEVLSGKPYETFMQERLFTPLGMVDTTFWPTPDHLARLATTYKPSTSGQGLEKTKITYLSGDLSDRKRMPMPAGGLFSCAQDLAHLYQMLLNAGELNGRRYIKAETLSQMTTNQLGDMQKVSFAPGMQMGLGFHIVHEPQGVTESLSPGSFGHGGAYGTQAWLDPVRGLAIVLLIQRAGLPNSDGSEMRRALQKAAVEKFTK